MSRITGISNACRVTLELVITIGDWSGNKTIKTINLKFVYLFL